MKRSKADALLRDLQSAHLECYNYLPPRETWMQSYDEGRRYTHMTTNLVECINDVFKGFRKLPVIGVVKGSYYRLNRWWNERCLTYGAQRNSGKGFSETVMNAMTRHLNRANSMRVVEFNAENLSFEVEEGYNHNTHRVGRKFIVELRAGRCDCGAFQAHHYPCAHAVAACRCNGWDAFDLVDPVFRLDTMLQAYGTPFVPLGDEDSWPEYRGPTLKPNPTYRRDKKGRPMDSRIHNEMDDREVDPPVQLCSICRNPGHNKRNCPHRARYL